MFVCSIRAFRVPESVATAAEESAAGIAEAAAGDSDIFHPPQITEMYTLTAVAMPLFSQYGYK